MTILPIGAIHQRRSNSSSTGMEQLEDSIDQVLLAIPSLSRSERRRILDQFQSRGIAVLQVPSVDDLTSGRARIDALRPIAIEDLLGRDEVSADPHLLGPGSRDAVVCVTGAGGRVVRSSAVRYGIAAGAVDSSGEQEQRCMQLNRSSVPYCRMEWCSSVLGSATDPQLLQRLFADQAVTGFHAAAYKHVPG